MGVAPLAPIFVGCSGWQYPSWRERFYPAALAPSQWLPFYAQRFPTVEVNSTFYSSPKEHSLQQWREQVPPGFLFAIKAHRFITHRKKLQQVDRVVAEFLSRVEVLGDKLGPILFQLPPRWNANPLRLETFLASLPQEHTYAFEFRHPSWFSKAIREVLGKFGAAFCVHDFPGLRVPRWVVGRTVYVRFHGTVSAYAGRYARPKLRRWARWLRQQARQGKTCFVYFNNDVNAAAVNDAAYLQALVRRQVVAPGPNAR